MNKNKIKCYELIMKQFRWELDKQNWFHKRFGICNKCESLRKQLKDITVILKKEAKKHDTK